MPQRLFHRVLFASTLASSTLVSAALPALAQNRPARGAAPAPRGDSAARPAADPFAGLKPRLIGPAMTSGRVMSVAVHPNNPGVMYVGTASGGLWKTTSGGAQWTPIFDREASYSIGTVVLDPQNPNTVWVGTGERNAQRSVAYGDGIYRSDDGGKSWKNLGLKGSEHIGKIVIHPKNSDVVYVAAQGPLWSAGGDRGLYKTTDGGKTWERVLDISEHTGVTDVVLDPRNPDVLVAAAWQRRRHFYTLIDGGPESAIHRSIDGGKTWTKVNTGLPNEELGRIGLAISPQNPDILYALVEAANRRGGFYRSADGGITWERRADYSQGNMYYGTIDTDPHQFDRLYIPDVITTVSNDGGRTWKPMSTRSMHVDHHVLWVDPKNPDHMLNGNDGGLYRSWDGGETWAFFANLPLAQYYDVDVDDVAPFYNVYGGLQDNNSLGMPSRTRSVHGILSQDVFVTQGGDGFVSRVDPKDPNIVYAELQHGVIVRNNLKTGERVGIQPKEEKGGAALRWNWDAPFIISPHANTRLYMAAQFLFRSDDRGNTWKKVSGDLTRALDRNKLAVMGKVWGPDAVAKNTSTADYSNISAIAESPKREGLLYIGTDDGLIQVSEDGGATWRKVERPAGVPADAYVTRIRASLHDANVAYATFSNHQNGDFKPYAAKTTDAGRTWTSIAGDLPARGSVFAFNEDHVDPSLLFVGTEFGAFYSRNAGQNWVKIAGLPTIKVADIAIQRREHDLVLGTFGRGVYILDDYTPLRATTPAMLAAAATLHQPKDALLYQTTMQYGVPGKGFQGELLYAGENPPYGAIFTYHLKDGLKTLKQQRVDAEKAAEKAGQPIRYPTADELRAEAEEEAPAILLTIADESGKAIRTITGPVAKGFQRVAWDLRHPAHQLPRQQSEMDEMFGGGQGGPYVVPGKYTVSLAQRVKGAVTPLGGPVAFNVVADPMATYTVADHRARGEFQAKLQELRRQVQGSVELMTATSQRLDAMRRALDHAPNAPAALHERVRAQVTALNRIQREIAGDRALGSRSDPQPASISERVNGISSAQARSLGPASSTDQEQFAIARELFDGQLAALRTIVSTEIPAIEVELEKAGAPYTPGRVPGAR